MEIIHVCQEFQNTFLSKLNTIYDHQRLEPYFMLFCYLWETWMIDIVVRGTKHSGTYWADKKSNCEWTVSISVPTISKYAFLCNSLTCGTGITRWHCFWVRSCCLFYISSNYWVEVVFRLKIKWKMCKQYVW